MVAVHWADRNPSRTIGVVAVDGAYPYDWMDDAAREHIRKLFRRLGWLFPLARPLGLAARMSVEQHAEVNIEINELLGSVGPVLERATVPVRFVVASGEALGSGESGHAQARATLDPFLDRNPNLTIAATAASNHSKILRRDFRAIADTVRGIPVTSDHPAG
jgi:hypothetical protein